MKLIKKLFGLVFACICLLVNFSVNYKVYAGSEECDHSEYTPTYEYVDAKCSTMGILPYYVCGHCSEKFYDASVNYPINDFDDYCVKSFMPKGTCIDTFTLTPADFTKVIKNQDGCYVNGVHIYFNANIANDALSRDKNAIRFWVPGGYSENHVIDGEYENPLELFFNFSDLNYKVLKIEMDIVGAYNFDDSKTNMQHINNKIICDYNKATGFDEPTSIPSITFGQDDFTYFFETTEIRFTILRNHEFKNTITQDSDKITSNLECKDCGESASNCDKYQWYHTLDQDKLLTNKNVSDYLSFDISYTFGDGKNYFHFPDDNLLINVEIQEPGECIKIDSYFPLMPLSSNDNYDVDMDCGTFNGVPTSNTILIKPKVTTFTILLIIGSSHDFMDVQFEVFIPGDEIETTDKEALNDINCGETYYSVITHKGKIYTSNELIVDHVIEHHEAKAATYDEVGWEAYEDCKNCDYTTYKQIDKLVREPEGEGTEGLVPGDAGGSGTGDFGDKDSSKAPDTTKVDGGVKPCNNHFVLIGLFAGYLLFVVLYNWVFKKGEKFYAKKEENKKKMVLCVKGHDVITCAVSTLYFVAFIIFAIFSKCTCCTVFIVLNIFSVLFGAASFLAKKKLIALFVSDNAVPQEEAKPKKEVKKEAPKEEAKPKKEVKEEPTEKEGKADIGKAEPKKKAFSEDK